MATRRIRAPRGKLGETLDLLKGSGPGKLPGRPLIRANAQIYNDRRYASTGEAAYAQQLDLEKAAGFVLEWTPQPRFELLVNGDLVCRYTADFDVLRTAGRREIVEVKGYATPIFKLRMRLFRATWLKENPDVRFVVVWVGKQKQ